MEKGNIFSHMEISMKVSIKIVKGMAMVYMNGMLFLTIRNGGNIYEGLWENGNQHSEGKNYSISTNICIKGI
jgi:hypothetical protein